MDSFCKNQDSTLSTDDVVSVTIDNLSSLTVSSNELTMPPKNNETEEVEHNFPQQSGINCNEVATNNSLLLTSDVTTIQTDVQSGNVECTSAIPENFVFTKDNGLTCLISTSVVPSDMIRSQRDAIRDKVKLDYVIRQNDHSNSQQNSSPRTLHPGSVDCVITLYDSDSEDSDSSSLDYYDDSTDEYSELEYLNSFTAERMSSSDKSLRSDGESVDSSDDPSGSDDDSDSSDDEPCGPDDEPCDSGGELSDDEPSGPDDEPCDSEEQPSDEEPCDSVEDCATTSDDEKPDPSDDDDEDDSGDEDPSSLNEEDTSDQDDEAESSGDDKSVDLGDTSESSSESSDNSE